MKIVLDKVKIFLNKIRSKLLLKVLESYWSVHMVNKKTFGTVEQSLEHFHWRNSIYPGYIELMPVNSLVVLDYGCGPKPVIWAFFKS